MMEWGEEIHWKDKNRSKTEREWHSSFKNGGGYVARKQNGSRWRLGLTGKTKQFMRESSTRETVHDFKYSSGRVLLACSSLLPTLRTRSTIGWSSGSRRWAYFSISCKHHTKCYIKKEAKDFEVHGILSNSLNDVSWARQRQTSIITVFEMLSENWMKIIIQLNHASDDQ